MDTINITLSANGYRALKAMIDNSFSICRNGCIYEEVQNRKDIDCDNCPYTIARYEIEALFD